MFIKTLNQSSSTLLILKKDEKIIGSIIDYCQNNKIESAWVSAIGAVSEAETGLYDLSNKKYLKQKFTGSFEIASLSGNISKKEDEIIAHIHAVFTNEEMKAFGGHLVDATVAATCEIYLTTFNEAITREFSDSIGLNLIVK